MQTTGTRTAAAATASTTMTITKAAIAAAKATPTTPAATATTRATAVIELTPRQDSTAPTIVAQCCLNSLEILCAQVYYDH